MNMKRVALIGILVSTAVALAGRSTTAADKAELSRNAQAALQALYEKVPAAKAIGAKSLAILVFPKVTKAGLGIGGQGGDGALIKGGNAVAYYRTSGASFGLQAGGQTYGYAMFLMTDSALEYLKKSDGWEVGVGPSFVVVDEGVARSLTTSSARSDIYVFFFGQKGLMGGLGIQGSKISKFDPNK